MDCDGMHGHRGTLRPLSLMCQLFYRAHEEADCVREERIMEACTTHSFGSWFWVLRFGLTKSSWFCPWFVLNHGVVHFQTMRV